MEMTLSDWINNIRRKYFANEKAGLICKELMKEFEMVNRMTENKRYKLSNIFLNNPYAICDNGEALTQNEVSNKLNEQDERIKELEKENKQLKQQLKEETDRIIKLEQYVYTKLCPKSEHYDEKILSEILTAILGDVDD